jgi:hypothetical protein
MDPQTLDIDGETYRIERSRTGITIHGPAPIGAPSPLLLEARAAKPADRRALAQGTSRGVATGQAALDRIAYVETELQPERVEGLFAGETDGAIERALGQHRGILRVRRGWTHLELRAQSVRAKELARAVARIARAARALDADSPALGERHLDAAFGIAFVAAWIGVLGVAWVVPWARFERRSEWIPSAGTGSVLLGAAIVGCTTYAGVRAVVRRVRAGRAGTHRRARAYGVAAGVSGSVAALMASVAINVLFDGGTAQPFIGTVVKHWRGKGGALTAICVARGAELRCASFAYPGDTRFGEDDPRGRTVAFDIRPGALGLRWVERIRLVVPPRAPTPSSTKIE